MAAGFYPDVFAVLGANLAQLKGRPHLAVELVLLLRHLMHAYPKRLRERHLMSIIAFPHCECSGRNHLELHVVMIRNHLDELPVGSQGF